MKLKSLQDMGIVREQLELNSLTSDDRDKFSLLEKRIWECMEEEGLNNHDGLSARRIARAVFNLDRNMQCNYDFLNLDPLEFPSNGALSLLENFQLKVEKRGFPDEETFGLYLLSSNLHRIAVKNKEYYEAHSKNRASFLKSELNSIVNHIEGKEGSFYIRTLNYFRKINNSETFNSAFNFLVDKNVLGSSYKKYLHFISRKKELKFEIEQHDKEAKGVAEKDSRFIGGIAIVVSDSVRKLFGSKRFNLTKDVGFEKILRKRAVDVSYSIMNGATKIFHLIPDIHRYCLLLDDRDKEKKDLLEEGYDYVKIYSEDYPDFIKESAYSLNLFIVNYIQEGSLFLELLKESYEAMIRTFSTFKNASLSDLNLPMHALNMDLARLDLFLLNEVLEEDKKLIIDYCKGGRISFKRFHANFSEFAFNHALPEYKGQYRKCFNFAGI